MSSTEAFFASRSMQALEVLAFGPATASQVAAELQVHPRTARRLLNRMVTDGWLSRRAGARPTYAPTMRIVALAAQLAQRAPLVRHATELAAELQARTGGAVHLAVPSYRSALRLVRVAGDGERPPELRDLAPANAIAAGKLLLAYREGWQRAVLAAPLRELTRHTLVDPERLREQLAAVRERGLAVEDEEFRVGVRAIAAPVRGEGEEVVAALALSAEALPLPALLDHGEAVAAAAAQLTARLAEAA